MPLRKRNGNWHFRFKVAGREYSGDTNFAASPRNRADAQAVEAEARKLVKQGQADSLHIQPKAFSDGLDAFLLWDRGEQTQESSHRRHVTSAASLRHHFGKLPINQLTPGRIEDYKAWRRSQGIKEVTIRHDLHCLAPFLRYARKQNWLRHDPMEGVEIPSDKDAVRIHVLTAAEEMAYFDACLQLGKRALHDLGRLMILQGCRPEELMELDRTARDQQGRPAVDLEAGFLRIVDSKTRAGRRSLRMMAESREILASRHLAPASSRWLFPMQEDAGRHIESLQKHHDAVLEATGLCFVLYDLRHTFATRFYQRTHDIAGLAAVLGHANLKSVMKYVHLQEADLDAAMQRYEAAQSADQPAAAVRFRSATHPVNDGTESVRRRTTYEPTDQDAQRDGEQIQ